MPDKHDPYRESLVMEVSTVWPAEFQDLDAAAKQRIQVALHADPAACGSLEYVRMHTGFMRLITVTQQDLDRVHAQP